MLSKITNPIKQAFRFIEYYLKSGNEHDVHSPFVFNLLTNAIYKKDKEAVFTKIENIRKELLKNHKEIEVTDLGAGSSFDGRLKKRTISDITSKFSKSSRYGQMLYRIVNHLQPATMIELGTSVGISAMYQAAGNTNGMLYTLEGCPATAKVAAENIVKCGFNNIKSVIGNFDSSFPATLEEIKTADYIFIDGNHTYDATMRYFQIAKKHIHENSVIIFDDINWSNGMIKAWDDIKADPDVTISLDFFMRGMVFFNKGFTKQNFVLKS